MKKCKACKEEIDSQATKCSKCGTDQRGFVRKHPILTVILVLLVIGFIGSKGGTKNTNTETIERSTTTDTAKPQVQKPSVPTEYISALAQANIYANTMYMSKRGVYDQLVSEYGGKFSAEAAQYGIDNVKADWNSNALKKAKTYQDTMHLSPKAISDQLVSDFGEKFTQEEADYAIQHLGN